MTMNNVVPNFVRGKKLHGLCTLGTRKTEHAKQMNKKTKRRGREIRNIKEERKCFSKKY
jgi:hypothetical protein